MSKVCFLGVDTSNYTTSLALACEGKILANVKKLLPVKEGECGLRQSDALFAHVKNLPEVSAVLAEQMEGLTVGGVGVSYRPRNQEGSYMPCFLAGVASAELVAATSSAPLYRFSHQCGHLRAALYSAGQDALAQRAFGAFHISGGTTEMLLVRPSENGFSAEIVGGTRDLNAGQLVDRIGVMLGLAFPCGAALEALALTNTKKIPCRKVRSENGYVHLSGVENIVRKLYDETGDAALCAAFLLDYLAKAVIEMSRDLRLMAGEDVPIVYAGGVMSNTVIRAAVERTLANVFFAEPAFSTDNAAGIALLAEEAFHKRTLN